MYRGILFSLLGALTLAALGGCYQSPDTHIYEPGVYKGGSDPLLTLEKTPKQQQRLQERFSLIQTDR